MKKKRNKMSALDKYIVFSIACIIIYTIAAHVLIIVTDGMTLDLLTTVFFGFFGGEITICALIKKLKLKQPDKEKEKGDETVG